MDGRPFYSLYYAGLRLFHFPVVFILLELSVKCLAVFLWILLYLGFLFFLLWLGLVALVVFAYAYAYGRGC
ncbi:hypothetical protein INS49_012261 [Diaporthe citri]|uniref:uncharacterized protein n=1 Tax=Diaporthe citri TaxID=83186 RepID=UPI001C81EFEA|nr:uncharacterized protein INS49_012261 [Diaporthe citri]KAG6358742.1 hypothetical protein INS49_012261 [Diaporthe citri]